MRLAFISDTHERHSDLVIPRNDVLVHCGDLTFRDYYSPPEQELEYLHRFNGWCRMLLRKGITQHVVAIAGNHDRAFEAYPELARDCLSDVTYLQDSGVEINGYKFWGSPWTPRFYDWAFQLNNDDHARETWKDVPEGLDVLITHGPAYMWRDENRERDHRGSVELARLVARVKPKIHACGHIHEGHGLAFDSHLNILRVNAASCNLEYKPKNKPILIDLK